jgi:hypothetical protein
MRDRLLLLGLVLIAAIALAQFSDASRADENKDLEKPSAQSRDLEKWAKADVAALQQLLAGKLERKDVKRAKVLAYVVGVDAQSLQWLTVHEQMDGVLAALGRDDLNGARTIVAIISPAKTLGKSVDLTKHFLDAGDWDRDLIMQLFKSSRQGGLGIEGKIKGWVAAGVGRQEFDIVGETAHKVSVIGSALEKMAPPNAKARQKPQWLKFSKGLQEASAEAIAAAGKKDALAAAAALTKVDAACVNCHTIFK